jgi:chromosome segregation ATPase
LEGELDNANQRATATDKRLGQSKERIAELSAGQGALETRLADRDTELDRLRQDYTKLQAELIEIAKKKPDSAE